MTISTTTGGATIRYTTDGSTPSSTAGTVYSSPVNISATATLQAIAYETGLTDSSVASGVYTISSPIPTTNLVMWLRADEDITLNGSNVSNWGDASGNNNAASQSNSSYQPAYVTNALNGLPVVRFSSSGTTYLQATPG